MRYRLAVLAPSVADVVRHAGGWMFDQVMAGWDVTVIVEKHENTRPLQILGATTLDLESVMAAPNGPRPQAIALAGDLFESNAMVREGLLDTLDRGIIDVTLWGDTVPSDLAHHFGPSSHQLSRAAMVFKSHALAAASSSPDPVGATEMFRGVSLFGKCPADGVNLVSVG
ncbi:hypothetical protein KYT97_14050 [Rhodococcus globerulus]|nr:hypothetical protein [Rhodococcus globerulus]MCE4266385.1 hypothetical protein [Rhodococcus globerulus]QXW05514.1 hypothetical protein KYT97_14050 [Rhodococcus globerulus]